MKLSTEVLSIRKLYADEDNYVVPTYQRDYSWEPKHIKQAWEDIIESWRSNSEYFMGAIVLCKEDIDQKDIYIVDGQQRLVTFAIICSIVERFAADFLQKPDREIYSKAEDIAAEKESASEIIAYTGRCLRNSRKKPLLTLSKNDNEVYIRELVTNKNILETHQQCIYTKKENALVKAKKTLYSLFIDNILKEFPDPIQKLEKFAQHLTTNIKFVSMTVSSGYDAYLLFESLNSKGLDLKVSDLIKNKILGLCKNNADQKERIEEIWNNIIINLQTSRFSNPEDFLRVYWNAFEERASKNNLYDKIKNRLTKTKDLTQFTSEIEKASLFFTSITDQSLLFPDAIRSAKKLSCFADLNTLKYSICYPVLLAAHNTRIEYINELATTILNFLFRVITIGDLAIGNVDDTMFSALSKIRSGKDKIDVLKTFWHPKCSDEEFKAAFTSKEYKDHNVAKYILTKIHLHEEGNESIPNSSIINLEHILPQKNTLWDNVFPDGTAANYVYKIGNMILINEIENKKAQNKRFSEKVHHYRPRIKNQDGGTTFRMANEIYQQYITNKITEWTATEIETRSAQLADIATTVWPLPAPLNR